MASFMLGTKFQPKLANKLFSLIVLAILLSFTGCSDAHLPGLASIQVSPANSAIDIGQSQQFTATGTFSDGSTKDLSNLVTWSSSNTSVATISSGGVALGQGKGSSMISALLNTVDGPVTGTTSVSVVVTLKSITITPVNPTIANGTTIQLTATGIFSDGSTQDLTGSVTWTSSSTGFATISSSGLVTGVAAGATTITATQGGVSGTTTVTVTGAVLTSITVTPPNSSIAKGTSTPLTATGNFSDGSTQDLTKSVTWTSSVPIATVSNAAGSQGLVTGTDRGIATITATLSGMSGSATVTVTGAVLIAIVVTPVNSSVPVGTTEPFTAIGAFTDGTTQDLTTQVSWTSSSSAMATVNNSGVVTGTGVGSPTITATLGMVSGSAPVTVTSAILTSLTITPATSTIPKGTNEELVATGTFSDGNTKDLTTSVTWASSDPSIAPISNADGSQGMVTGSNTGPVNISATLPSVPGVTGSATVTVTAATLTSIAVTPADPSIAFGGTAPLTATGTYSDKTMQDLTSQVGWTSSMTNLATVDPTGLVTGTGVGAAPITATFGNISGSTTVTVVLTPCNVGDGTAVAAYNAIPFNVVNCSLFSQNFEASSEQVNEFGNGVVLAAGTGRTLLSLKVVFANYACGDSGNWTDGTCQTTPGETFMWPITANIYDASDLTTPIAKVTQTQTFSYRPSADPVNCPNAPNKWFNPNNISDSVTSPGKCQNSISTVLTFDFSTLPTPVTLPDQVVWTVEFNTTDFGPSPIGPAPCDTTSAGCFYDSLNVGVMMYTGSPYSGSSIDPNGVVVNSANPNFGCNGGATNVLRPDTGCWAPYTPLGEIITH